MDGVLESAAAEALVCASLGDGGRALLRVTGTCLEPRLAEGERVRLASPATRPARFGDVVLARLPAGLRLHRLVWPLSAPRAGSGVRTKADRAPFLDPAVSGAAILATVVGVERGARVVPVRDVACAARSLAGALLARIGVALGWPPA